MQATTPDRRVQCFECKDYFFPDQPVPPGARVCCPHCSGKIKTTASGLIVVGAAVPLPKATVTEEQSEPTPAQVEGMEDADEVFWGETVDATTLLVERPGFIVGAARSKKGGLGAADVKIVLEMKRAGFQEQVWLMASVMANALLTVAAHCNQGGRDKITAMKMYQEVLRRAQMLQEQARVQEQAEGAKT